MQLSVNGALHRLEEPGCSLAHLLAKLGYEPESIAVAVDGCFVPRHAYADYALSDQQALEVLAPMQGG